VYVVALWCFGGQVDGAWRSSTRFAPVAIQLHPLCLLYILGDHHSKCYLHISLSPCPSLSLCHCPPLFLCVSVSFCFSLPQILVGSSLFVSGFFVLDLYVVMFCSFLGFIFGCVCGCAAICGHRSLCSQLLSCTRICHHHSWPCWSCTHLLCACLCGSRDGEVTTCKTQGQDQLTNSPPLCHPKRETDDHRSHYCCVYIPLCRQFQAQERHFMSPRHLSAGKPCSCNCHLFSGIGSMAAATTHSGCTSGEKFSSDMFSSITYLLP
jgi:hypothetical protein